MQIEIIGDVDKNRLYCAGSFTKLLTTFVCLSLLAEKYNLKEILDDKNFLDSLATTTEAKNFLTLFQNLLTAKFSIRDLCSFYSGLPYTFDLALAELTSVEAGNPFKHHSIPDEKTFLLRCHKDITPVYKPECKFHYSEIGIIFLGYFIEKTQNIKIESLFEKYIINKFQLKHSHFASKRPATVYTQDLSPHYDYPSIAILDHGYFCYSNGFYTTLNDTKVLLEHLLKNPIFAVMTDIKQARAASNRLLNGLTIELRLVNDDIIYGYEGLSFSGCNLWAYSTKYQKGYLTFNNSEELIYDIVYDKFNYKVFDIVPAYTQTLYKKFMTSPPTINAKPIPPEFQGIYQRVNINTSELAIRFHVGENFIIIRNPDEIRYDIIYSNNAYRVKGKDNIGNASLGFNTAASGNKYMIYDGTLYRRINT